MSLDDRGEGGDRRENAASAARPSPARIQTGHASSTTTTAARVSTTAQQAAGALDQWLSSINLSQCADELRELGIGDDLEDLQYLEEEDLRKLTSLKAVAHFRKFVRKRKEKLASLGVVSAES